MKIGMFDSGVGGITVLKEFLKILPENEYIYFGDTKRVPYGGKSAENIKLFSIEIIDFLIKQNVDIIIAACNTVSAVCLNEIKNNYDIKIIGVIEPTVDYILKTDYKNIGIIGTKATVQSKVYTKILEKNNIKTYNKACPLFVPVIEENIQKDVIVDGIIDLYLSEFRDIDLDAIVLACTHYPIIENKIRKYLPDTDIINPAFQTAEYTKKFIVSGSDTGNVKFYFTDITDSVYEIATSILGFDVSDSIYFSDFS